MRATVGQILDGIKERERDYATMNIYSGNSRCVKCGGLEAGTALRKKSLFTFFAGMGSWDLFNDTAYEVIERRCPKCGHTWQERPLDAPIRNGEVHYSNVDQAIGILDSLCASPALPSKLYDWQKEAWTYVRSYIIENQKVSPFPCPYFSFGSKCTIGLMPSTGCQHHCMVSKPQVMSWDEALKEPVPLDKSTPPEYSRTDLINKWSGYKEVFDTQREIMPVLPWAYVKNLLESLISDLKSGLGKFEEIQNPTDTK